jgi:hypothetical protein
MWKWLILCTAALLHSGPAPQQAIAESRSETTENRQRVAQFKPVRMRWLFRKSNESDRLAELDFAAQHHLQHPELPAVLTDSIQFNLDRNKVTLSVLEAVRLFCRLDEPSLKDQQLAFAKNRSADVSVAVVAAGELARRQVPEALAVLPGLAERPEFSKSFGMRRAVVDSAANYSRPAAIDFLIATLAEHDGLLRYEIARHLSRLTGQNFGGYPEHWQKWWEANKAEFRFDSAEPAGTVAASVPDKPPAMPWPQVIPKFFGQAIYGTRVLFVIDQSRSMLSTVDGVTRIEEVQEELEQVISDLPDAAFFNMIAYEEERQLWAGELVESTPEARSDAIRFVYSLLPRKKTALYDALEQALRHDENIEQIVLLSDGKPTAGRVVHPSVIVELISRQNAFSQTTINAVGIDTHGEERLFLEQLTSRNFGELRVIR